MKNDTAKKAPLFRTVNKLVSDIKEADPSSCISAFFIRGLVKDDKILYRKSNTKVFVNVDSFWAYMNGTDDGMDAA